MAGGRIYQRGLVYFIAYSLGGREFRESTRSTDIDVAQRLLAERLAGAAPVDPTAPRVPFDDLCRLYLDEYEIRQYRTPDTAAGRVKNLKPFFGSICASAITTALIHQYQAARRKAHAAAATINRETAALKKMFRLAVAAGRLTTIPYFPESLPENPPRQGFFEHAEYLAVRAHLPAPYQDVLDFAYYSGWRHREITELTWAEVDAEGGVIRLDPARSKTRRGRVLPIAPALRVVLERRLKRRKPGDRLVFDCDGVTQRDWKRRGLVRASWRVCRGGGYMTAAARPRAI